MFSLFLFLGLWTARSDEFTETDIKKTANKIFISIALICILIFMFTALIFGMIFNSLAEHYYGIAYEIGTSDKDSAIENLEKSNSFYKKGKTYVGLSQLYLFKADEYLKQSKDLETKEDDIEEDIQLAAEAIKKAEEYAIKATEINSADYSTFVNLGNVYINEKYITEIDLTSEAIEAYEKAIVLAPQNIDAYEGLIEIYEEQENKEEMLKYLDIVVKIDPNNQTYYTKYRNLLMTNSQEELE
jgi:tetratricopeptide (TPR) repeat protein